MSRSHRSLVEPVRPVMAPAGREGRGAGSLTGRWWRAAGTWSAHLWRIGAQTARLAIGIPDYENYVEHIRRHHPEREPMDRDTFFHERMQARYGKGRSRCC